MTRVGWLGWLALLAGCASDGYSSRAPYGLAFRDPSPTRLEASELPVVGLRPVAIGGATELAVARLEADRVTTAPLGVPVEVEAVAVDGSEASATWSADTAVVHVAVGGDGPIRVSIRDAETRELLGGTWLEGTSVTAVLPSIGDPGVRWSQHPSLAPGDLQLTVRLEDWIHRRVVDTTMTLAVAATSVERRAWDAFAVAAPPLGEHAFAIAAGDRELALPFAIEQVSVVTPIDAVPRLRLNLMQRACFEATGARGVAINGVAWSFESESPVNLTADPREPGCVLVVPVQAGALQLSVIAGSVTAIQTYEVIP